MTGQPARGRTPWLLLAGVAVAVLVVDQLTKWWALSALADGPIEVAWGLQWNLVRNKASAFSLGGGSAWGPLVSVMGLAIVVGLLWMVRSSSSRWGAVFTGLVIGGAIGNLIDRAARSDSGFMGGGVVDFVDLGWWPVFNVADAAVVVGVIGLVLVTLIGERADPQRDAQPRTDGGRGA